MEMVETEGRNIRVVGAVVVEVEVEVERVQVNLVRNRMGLLVRFLAMAWDLMVVVAVEMGVGVEQSGTHRHSARCPPIP